MLEWVREKSVADDFFQIINCTGLASHPHALGRVLSSLDSNTAKNLLLRWSAESECAQTLRRISEARQVPDPRFSGYRPLPDEVPATTHVTTHIATYYLTALLVARLPVVAPDHREWFERLRLWLFVHCLERAALGNHQDKHLETACSKLRLAHDGNQGWVDLFEQLRTNALGFEHIGVHLASTARQMLDSPISHSTLSDTQKNLLESLISVSLHEHEPKADVSSFPYPRDEPTWIGNREFWDELSDASSETEALTPDEPAQAKIIPGTDESGDLRQIPVNEKASYSHQNLHANSVLLAAAEDLHFLPWSWNRPNPAELPLLVTWIQCGLAAPDPAYKAIAAFSLIALITGRTLRRALDIPLGTTPSREWTVDRAGRRLLRLPVRRIPGWTPDGTVELAWVAPFADVTSLAIPDAAADILNDLPSKVADPKSLGELWDAAWGDSPESAFLKYAKADLPRLTPAMLSNVLPQHVFLQKGDGAFVRLLSSHPKSGLPGATAYAAWNKSHVDSALSNFVATLGCSSQTVDSREEALNAQGSQLDVLEDLLKIAIEKLNFRVDEIRSTASPLDFHNAFTTKLLLKLYAASGARPLRDPFCNPLHFGFEDATLYIDDKHSQRARTGRLITLPRVLMKEIEHEYCKHLTLLATALKKGAPELSAAMDALSQGKNSTRLPFFFLLDASAGRIKWRHASEKNLGELGLFDCPLPLNLFRHRLATRQRNQGVDPELIDALLGHAEAGAATHGDYSFRVWQDDMSSMQDSLDLCFESLGFSETRTWPTRIEEIKLDELLNACPTDFGSEGRAKDRRSRIRAAISSAKGIIIAHQKGKALEELTKIELEALSRALLTNEAGLPHPLGALRFSVLINAANELSKAAGKKLRLSNRYRQLEDEISPFTHRAPGAIGLLARLQTQIDSLVEGLTQLRLGKQDSTIVASVLLIIQSRIADRSLIRDVMSGRNIRLIRARPGYYLEHGINLRGDDPTAPVHRHRISNAAARLLNIALDRSQQRAFENAAIPAPLRQISERLIKDGRLREHPAASHLFATLADTVDQANIQSFPGVVAGYLGGRITSTSLEWRDWLRLRWDQRIAVDSLTEEPADAEPDNNLPIRAPDTEDIEVLQEQARTLFSVLRSDLDPGRETSDTAPLAPNARRDIKAAIRKTLSTSDGDVPRACLLLGAWLGNLLDRKSGNDDFLSRGAIKRYFGALSPAFEAVGYNIDLELADEDAITEFYSELLEARELRHQDFVFARLKEFHLWLAKQIEIEDPVWSELPCHNGSVPVDPGIIVEKDYLHALSGLSQSPTNNEQSRYAAFLLLCAYRFGLRGAEALGLQRSDWISLGKFHMVVVQNNTQRKLKRPASRRVVPLLTALTATESRLIEWANAAADARSGDDQRALIFPSADRKTQQQLRRSALEELKSATGNPDSNLHRLRHCAANQLMLAIAGLDLPAWAGVSEIAKIETNRAQDLLLGRRGATRRAAWATARYLGHAGPRTAFQNYFHFISDFAEIYISLPDEKLRPYANAIDLTAFPASTINERLPELADQTPIYGPVERVIKSLRLLARGQSVDAVEDWMGWKRGEVLRLERVVAGINSRMTWQERDDGRKTDDRLEWLKRIRNDGWNRLLSLAGKVDKKLSECSSAPISMEIAQNMVGGSRQLLAWRNVHFEILSLVRDFWEIKPDQYAFLMAGENERMRSVGLSFGFEASDPKEYGNRAVGHQIDVAFDDHEKILRVATRCSLCLKESDDATIRNRFELIVAMVSISSCDNYEEKQPELARKASNGLVH